MRNLKKLLAVLVVVVMVATTMIPAFAAESTTFTYSAQATKLNDLGLYLGTGTATNFVPALDAAVDRQTGVVLLLRLLGKDAAALALTDADVSAALDKATDLKDVKPYFKKYMAYAVANKIYVGVSTTALTLDAAKPMTGNALAALILRNLGYTQDALAGATDALATANGLTADQAKAFAEKDLKRDDLVGMSFGTLSAKDKAGKVVIQNLVDAKAVTAAKATAAGFTVVDSTAAAALDISGAVALNSKVIEVSLATAAKAADLTVANVTVKDSAAKAVEVASVEVAPYVTDSKTALVTLKADTTAGSLYTVTSGTKSANFGGQPADTTKPTALASSTDYNEVTVTFSEAIKLETAKVTITKKYGDKAALATTTVKYNGSNKLVFASADQADATLYAVTVENATDFAGNVMTKDEGITFVGQAKSTADQEVVAAKALDYKTIYVAFSVNVDPATIAAANFTLAEMYGTKAAVVIADAKAATATQSGKYDAALTTDDQKNAAAKKGVVLTLTGEVKDATLYKVVAANVKTLYGKALSSTEAKTYASFTGKSKPGVDSVTYTATASSNTEVTLTFANDLDKTSAETLANYSIAKAYGDKAALAVSKVVLDANVVKLTVAAMAIDMYKVTALNVKDIYGNSIKTSSDSNIVSFAGKAIGAKIDGFTGNIVDTTATTGTIRVTFNQSYGAGALDVSSYTLDNSIGYPSKVAAVSGSTTAVDLTIPKTATGTLYKLTVKNVKNSDGVAMDAAGITKTFVGTGGTAALPKLEAAYALNSNTIKLYFNKNVEDISGIDLSTPANTALEMAITGGAAVTVTQAYVDPADKKVLIAYSTSGNFKDGLTDDSYTVTLATAGLDATANAITFAENTSDAAKITVSGVVAVNSKTLNVYFNQPVRFLNPGTDNGSAADAFGYVETGATAGFVEGTDSEITNARAITDDSTVWEVSLDKALTNTQYSLVLNAYANTLISNIASGTTLNVLDTTLSFAFAGNGTDSLYVSDVYAVGVDTRTIKVYFPEAMNQSDVETPGKYTVVNAADGDLTSTVIKLAVYDAATKTVTLTTNANFASSTTGYYLVVSPTVQNALGTKTVKKDATTSVKTEFALGTAAPAKLLVSSVSVSGQTITVKFNQRFKTNADVTVTGADATELVKYLKLTVNGSTVLADTNIDDVKAKLGTGANANSSAAFVDTLVIHVTAATPALTPNGQGTAELLYTAPAAATAINAEIQDKDMAAVVFVQ